MAIGISPAEIVEIGQYSLLEKAPHWFRVPLCEVACVQNGFPFKSSLFSRKEGMPLVRIRDISSKKTEHRYTGKYDDEYVIKRGEILVGMDGDFNAAYWSGENALLNQRVCKLSVFSKNYDQKFFFLCLQPYLNAINAETSSVTVKHLSSRTIEDIPLPLPPLNEQRRIVAKIEELFSELDKGIESLKTARDQLKIYRQAVLKQAFEGQWRLVSVKDVLLQPPSNGRSVKDRENGFPVLRLTALKGRQVDLAERKNGNWERDEALPFLIREGDFLLSRGNGSKHLVGRGGIVPKHTEEIAYPDTIVRLKINPELMNVKFFCLLWNSRILRDQIEQSARTTAGIYKINQRQINGFKLPITSSGRTA
jgi:type I restriction enzyme, S subunit